MHSGFNREHLQDCCNLFAFIHNGNEPALVKVYELIEMGLSKPILYRYRKNIVLGTGENRQKVSSENRHF